MSEYLELTDDLCQPGKFMDTLAPDVRKRATTIDANPATGASAVAAQAPVSANPAHPPGPATVGYGEGTGATYVDATKPTPRTGGMDGLVPVVTKMYGALVLAEAWLRTGSAAEVQIADRCLKALDELDAWRKAK
jgi:hypothetical protein